MEYERDPVGAGIRSLRRVKEPSVDAAADEEPALAAGVEGRGGGSAGAEGECGCRGKQDCGARVDGHVAPLERDRRVSNVAG